MPVHYLLVNRQCSLTHHVDTESFLYPFAGAATHSSPLILVGYQSFGCLLEVPPTSRRHQETILSVLDELSIAPGIRCDNGLTCRHTFEDCNTAALNI